MPPEEEPETPAPAVEPLSLSALPTIRLKLPNGGGIEASGFSEEGCLNIFEHALTRYLQVRDDVLPTPPVETSDSDGAGSK